MARHRLSSEETQLWGRLAATVRPIRGKTSPIMPLPSVSSARVDPVSSRSSARPAPLVRMSQQINQTLDAGWDKRLATGKAIPDRTIDLHGHTLASAHALLDRAIGEAIRTGARLILLVTGRPAAHNPRMPPTGRGVIRASVADWIAAGPYASRIAAIRNAHPRHGGAGALYLIIKRDRSA